ACRVVVAGCTRGGAAAAGPLQLTQPEPGTATRREAALWHDRDMVVRRELAGRTGGRCGDAAARELWNEVERSQAAAGDEADALARRAQGGNEAAGGEVTGGG